MSINEDIKTMYRHDFDSFADFAFRELHLHVDYQHNWHMSALAEVLTRVSNGEIKRLIINLPPRTLKSHFVSVAFPAWLLGRDPNKKILCLHGSITLGQSLHGDCQELMTSPRYREIFSQTAVEAAPGQIKTGAGGGRQHMPIMGRLTGLGADIVILDDPISALDAQDDAERQRLHDQFDQNVVQRLNDKNTGTVIVVMQRLHENDLSTYLMAKNEDWHLVSMPAIAFEDETWTLPHGKTHIRRKGEALHEVRESREQLIETMHAVGGYAFSYQYLQGRYKPRFGIAGKGCIYTTRFQKGVYYKGDSESQIIFGFVHYLETDFILGQVFGIGYDMRAWLDNMRTRMTREEFEEHFKDYRQEIPKID
jgi:hypothetical protein